MKERGFMGLTLRFVLLSILASCTGLRGSGRLPLMRAAQAGLVGGAVVNAVEALVGKRGREIFLPRVFVAGIRLTGRCGVMHPSFLRALV